MIITSKLVAYILSTIYVLIGNKKFEKYRNFIQNLLSATGFFWMVTVFAPNVVTKILPYRMR